jgi:hypothetical protein
MGDILTHFPEALVREFGKYGHEVSIQFEHDFPRIDLRNLGDKDLYLEWDDTQGYTVSDETYNRIPVSTFSELIAAIYQFCTGRYVGLGIKAFLERSNTNTPLR